MPKVKCVCKGQPCLGSGESKLISVALAMQPRGQDSPNGKVFKGYQDYVTLHLI